MITKELTLVTSNNCVDCKSLKMVLNIKNVRYTELNLDLVSDELREWIVLNSESRSIPQLFNNTKFLCSGQLDIIEEINNNFI